MLSTVDEFNDKYKNIFSLLNDIIMPIFILEYLVRVYVSGVLDPYKGFIGKLKYMLTPYALIDLISIAPYLLTGLDLNSTFMRSLRLLRIFRLFRMKKYAIFAKVMQDILSSKKEQFIVLLFFTLVIIVLLSFIIFELEHAVQPNVFSNVFQTLWWAVATLTTVGYGDMYPVTTLGKFITAIISIIGIGFIAIPGGIFASEFINSFEKNKAENEGTCIKCSSSAIESIGDPVVNCNDDKKIFSELKYCKDCKQHWLV